MSTQATNDGAVAIYDSVTGLPYRVAVFEDSEQAHDFLDWFFDETGNTSIREFSPTQLETLRNKWARERLDQEGILVEQ